MKKNLCKNPERLLIDSAIESLDKELCLVLQSADLKLSEIEIKTAVMLKCGYSITEICIYTSLGHNEIRRVVRSILKKTKNKNINQLINYSSKIKGGNLK